MKSIRILRIVILLLVCANLFLMFKHYGKPQHPPKLSHIVRAEGLQARRLDKEMRRHHSAVQTSTKRLFKLRQSLANSNQKDTNRREELLDQIAHLQRQIDSVTVVHFDHVDALCTAPQKKRFHQFRKRLLQPYHFKN